MIGANISDEMEISNTYITEPDEVACTISSKNSINAIVIERIHDVIPDISRLRKNITLESIIVQACVEGIDILLDSYKNLVHLYKYFKLLKYL